MNSVLSVRREDRQYSFGTLWTEEAGRGKEPPPVYVQKVMCVMLRVAIGVSEAELSSGVCKAIRDLSGVIVIWSK